MRLIAPASSALPPPSGPGGRDHRIDFWRGVALVMIFVNHIPGNAWQALTSTRFGFSDAAEIFVLLAGLASAHAYGRPFLLGGRRLVTAIRALRRAGVLLLVHFTLTTLALGLFSFAVLAFGQGGILGANAMWTLVHQPFETLVGLSTLTHQLGFVNILPMYAVLLAFLPVLLALARVAGRGGMLGASALLWLACGVWRFNLPNYPFEGGWYFDPFAWQFLFAVGLFLGLRAIETGRALRFSPLLFGLAAAYLVAALATVKLDCWSVWLANPLPFAFSAFDKTYLTAPRLLHVLSLAVVAAGAMHLVPALRPGRANMMATLGRHGLPVFAVGTVLSLLAQILRFGRPVSFPLDTALVVSGVAILWALALFLDWWRVASRAGPAAAPAVRTMSEDEAGIEPIATARAGDNPVLG